MSKTSITVIKKHLSKDNVLKPIVLKHKPLQLDASTRVFQELVKNIVYQQISYKAADTIFARFINLMDDLDYLPADLLQMPEESLRSVGLSRQKASYLHNIAAYFQEHELYDIDWSRFSDQEIIKTLSSIKGVGQWTAKMILMFQLHRPDVFPYEDLAIQYVVRDLYDLKSTKKQFINEMNEIAEAWKPYRTTASLYLWSYRRAAIEGS